jgi:hypothetical protein
MVVCDDELERHRSMMDADHAAALAGDHGINHAVSDDINTMFTGKNSAELNALDVQIKGHIEQGHAADVEYWENLLKRLQIHKVIICLAGQVSSLIRTPRQNLNSVRFTKIFYKSACAS